MQNKSMKRKIEKRECIDIADRPKNDDGDYILSTFVDGMDYCDAQNEWWIWSIGKHNETGQILASTTTKFYQNPNYECLFLR